MNDRSKNIIMGILILLIIVLMIAILSLTLKRENTLKEIVGKVIIADQGYVLVEGKDGNCLDEDIEGTYEIGDKVRFIYKVSSLKSDENPKRVVAEEEVLLEPSSVSKVEIDEPGNQNRKPSSTPSTSKDNSTDKLIGNGDDLVISYFDDLNAEIKSSTIKDSFKNSFVTVVDFLFYEGRIKGYTFKDLSESARLKILSIALYLDKNIDTYFPSYKNSISSTSDKIYANIKKEIISSYLNVTTKICDRDEELCKNAIE